MILIAFLTELLHAEVLENFNLQRIILPAKECNLISASQLTIDKGMNLISNRHDKKPLTCLDLGRGTIRFRSFQKLKNVAYGEIFRSQARSMYCLTTITQTTNELQISEMIDIMSELHIPQRYLIIFVDTLNTTKLSKITINFNVMINHKGKGVLKPILLSKLSNNNAFAICF